MTETRNKPGTAKETTRPVKSTPGDPTHGDQLLDESLEESFPASDAPLAARPGSSLSEQAATGRATLRVAIILGSTRPGRNGEAVTQWVQAHASRRADAQFEVVDIARFNLPLLDEPIPPSLGQYGKAHTRAWAAKIDSFDAFLFVTPEYNHGIPGALKNAIDFIYAEWNNKAAGFVSYGSAGGARAVEQLRLVMAELQVADVRSQVLLSLHTDFENMKVFKPAAHQEKALQAVLDQVIAWGAALQAFRKGQIRAPQRAAA
jgi:NAD(P)H-dependent FMN reductase